MFCILLDSGNEVWDQVESFFQHDIDGAESIVYIVSFSGKTVVSNYCIEDDDNKKYSWYHRKWFIVICKSK